MKLLFAYLLIVLTTGAAGAERFWVNNITVNEYNMAWNYTETFTGMDSIAYRVSIDSELGNNDSFINVWELLLADKDMRRNLRSAIDMEPDVRIDNLTSGVEVIDLESLLSPDIIGKTHSTDTIVNNYSVSYRFKDSIINASSIWFLGQAKSPVIIVVPAGVDVINITGMDNITKNIADHNEVSGFFKEISKDRGEITLSLARNSSFRITEINASNVTSPAPAENTQSTAEVSSKIRYTSIVVVGLVIILLIYVFRVKRR